MRLVAKCSSILSLVLLAGCVATVAPEDVKYQHYLAKHVDLSKKAESLVSGIGNEFGIEDRIYVLSIANWDPELKGEKVEARWDWYTGDELRYTHGRDILMKEPPHRFWGRKSGVELGKGEHRVVIYLDDKKEEELHFSVK
ncbi:MULTISPECIES: hypothetical protein [Vibrio]|uniref:hypothetical protein n=1 Tax=Vibrio TaxID=662 RepID=UPI000C9EAA62|nr:MULTISPECIES: hypothetical protein [Vibrio]MCF7361453.1 hypothetical protein [Vibrio sp. A1-b2]MCZ4373140.1 hypothetical protein [Vibrio diazotrophicus]PNH81933.1 hypothetical protein C1N27_04315 [Vibrio diazotrophicus]